MHIAGNRCTDLGILAVNWQAGVTGTPVSLPSALQAIGLTSVPEPLNAMTFISLGFMLFTRLH